jgi:hypothetical protein
MGSGQGEALRFRKCRVPKPHPTFPEISPFGTFLAASVSAIGVKTFGTM